MCVCVCGGGGGGGDAGPAKANKITTTRTVDVKVVESSHPVHSNLRRLLYKLLFQQLLGHTDSAHRTICRQKQRTGRRGMCVRGVGGVN